MRYQTLYNYNRNCMLKTEYQCIYYKDFDFGILKNIMYVKKPGRNSEKISDCIMMLDTETSRSFPDEICENYIVAWSLSIRAYHFNIVTLYGNKPSECLDCLDRIMDQLPGNRHYMYIYNLSYDWMFLRKFLIHRYDIPVKQLNTKSHYPIYIEFENGLILRDALCLAQRKLEKWAQDLDVEHQKAVGSWDYDLIRNQDHIFTQEELHYIENDTLAGVECIDKLMTSINKRIYSMPWTATGIPRDEVKKRGKTKRGNQHFKKMLLSYEQQQTVQKWLFHGGYTHGNRLFYNDTVYGNIECYDFASSYPFVMLSEKFPSEKCTPMPDCSMYDILDDTDNAYFFKMILINVKLKDYLFPMPALQFSKCQKIVNPDIDNGRVIECDYAEIWLTEVDLEVIEQQYDIEKHICINVYAAYKQYLPRWYTDYIYELFEQKTKLKKADSVQYAVAKANLNSLYGMTVQRPVPMTLEENYITGEYEVKQLDPEEEYEKYCNRKSNVLNYQIGVWVTAYAMRNLFRLGSCCHEIGSSFWLYSDTDSVYGMNWNKEKLETYNAECKEKMLANDYGPVIWDNKEYWLGVAEHDGSYSEFKVIHAKTYCTRSAVDGKLKITVAGVPKSGAACLDDDIRNFRPGCVFPGTVTGKKMHTYFYADAIHIDKNGNEIGDSIDLSPCDYLLNDVYTWDDLRTEHVEVPFYE